MDLLSSLPVPIPVPSTYLDYASIAACIAGISCYASRHRLWDRADELEHLLYERPQLKRGGAVEKRKEVRNIRRKLDETGSRILIFWGSQSGTAEGFSNRLARELETRYALACLSADLSDYDADSIAEISRDTIVLFILSTFGEGDPSDNTAGLWHWIRNELPSLPDLRYMAFGLGNSNYKYFNKVVDVVTEGLDTAGAQALMQVVRADDALGGTEEDFVTWKESVFAHLETHLGFTARQSQWSPKYIIEPLQDSLLTTVRQTTPTHAQSTSNALSVQALSIIDTKELCSQTASRSCLHVDLDISANPTLSYKTGDHLILWPSNPSIEVNRLLNLLNGQHNVDEVISITAIDGSKVKVPSPSTLLDTLRFNLEICAPVSRELAGQLAQFAPSETASLFLQNLAKDRVAYQEFKLKHRPNLARLMELASHENPARWTSLPLSFLIEVLPAMKPRYYSISSSAITTPRIVSLTVSVVDNTAGGVASNYLSAYHKQNPSLYCLNGPQDLLTGSKVYAQLRKSTFKLPTLASQPIIMVAAGTGIAPFRAFIQERARLQQIGKPSGKMVLFFGCRHPKQDYLYHEELQDLRRELGEENLVVITAFSRQTPEQKVYVQHRLRENPELVLQMLTKNNANLYVCGSAAMAREVNSAVTDIVKAGCEWEDDRAREWMHSLKRTRKFQEEVWG